MLATKKVPRKHMMARNIIEAKTDCNLATFLELTGDGGKEAKKPLFIPFMPFIPFMLHPHCSGCCCSLFILAKGSVSNGHISNDISIGGQVSTACQPPSRPLNDIWMTPARALDSLGNSSTTTKRAVPWPLSCRMRNIAAQAVLSASSLPGPLLHLQGGHTTR